MSIQDLKYLKQNSRENSVKLHFPFNYLKTIENKENKTIENVYLNIFSGNVSLNTLSKRIEDKNDFILNNVFTIHILDVYFSSSPTINYILSVYANDNLMDSITINQQSNCNITGREYEKIMVNPLAKVTELTFKLTENNNIINDSSPSDPDPEAEPEPEPEANIQGNISILIRNYEPQTEFNDNYNELNPQYNPHITLDYTSSDEED